MIRRDIARTYPEHDFFKEKDGLGQESLFNVMKAYSLHDREVGYCQGSAFIVGILLMQVRETCTLSTNWWCWRWSQPSLTTSPLANCGTVSCGASLVDY